MTAEASIYTPYSMRANEMQKMIQIMVALMGWLLMLPTWASIKAPLSITAIKSGDSVLVVGFFDDAQCSAKHQIAERRMNLSSDCFVWVREAGSGMTRSNAASHMRCYQDRVCYRQYPGQDHCSGHFFADKSFSIHCQSEGRGVWSKILSGTAHCPASPKHFSCPKSQPSAQMRQMNRQQ